MLKFIKRLFAKKLPVKQSTVTYLSVRPCGHYSYCIKISNASYSERDAHIKGLGRYPYRSFAEAMIALNKYNSIGINT